MCDEKIDIGKAFKDGVFEIDNYSQTCFINMNQVEKNILTDAENPNKG